MCDIVPDTVVVLQSICRYYILQCTQHATVLLLDDDTQMMMKAIPSEQPTFFISAAFSRVNEK